MKKSIFIFGALLVLVGCSSRKQTSYAIISGKIESPSKEGLLLVNGRQIVKEIKPTKEGVFQDTIMNLDGKFFYQLILGQKSIPLYVEEGTALHLQIPNEIKNVKITGKGAENVKFLLEKSAYLRENLSVKDKDLFGKNPEEFKKSAIVILEKLRSILNNKKLDKKFTDYEQKWLDYYFIQLLEDYPKYSSLITKEVPAIPSGYNSEKEKINYDQSDLYNNVSTFQALVRNYLYQFYPTYNDTAQIQRLIKEGEKFQAESIRLEIARVLASYFKIDGENNAIIYNFIDKYVTDATFRNEFQNVYQNSQKLSKGMPSPSFSYENYKGGVTSLSDFKGKLVYIDVWATWCMPCLQEVPYLQELEKKFHGKPVEFVSISIDEQKDLNRWRQFIEKKELKGVQLIADKAWKSEFISEYVIKGIPRFILIDKEGKIIKADAPRPSDPATADLIENNL